MLGRKSQIARMQSDFYRDQLKRVLKWILAEVILMFFVLLAVFYVVATQPAQKYYANTTEGKIMPMPMPR